MDAEDGVDGMVAVQGDMAHIGSFSDPGSECAGPGWRRGTRHGAWAVAPLVVERGRRAARVRAGRSR